MGLAIVAVLFLQKYWRGTVLVAGALLCVYVGSYVILSRRGFDLSDQFDLRGFYFIPPEDTDEWRRAESDLRLLYLPLICVDYGIGTGRWPAPPPTWRLS